MRLLLVALSSVFLAVGCGEEQTPELSRGDGKLGNSCNKTEDCRVNLRCIDRECVPDIPAGTCQAYDDRCPGFAVWDCERDCENPGTYADMHECDFWACAVELRLCDNEDDEAIGRCAEEKGWY